MKKWPNNLERLITYFGRLPGIGPKMAERIVLHLHKNNPADIKQFSESLATLPHSIKQCTECYTLSSNALCDICADKERDRTILCITADPVSVLNIEKSEKYHGYYFVLGGTLNPIEGITPDKLRIKELGEKIKNAKNLKEVTLAFSSNVEGEATLLYLKKLLREYNKHLAITRIARGLPMGSDVHYADEITLGTAMRERQKI